MFPDRPRGIDFWSPTTPKGSETAANSQRSSLKEGDRFFTSSVDFPQQPYSTCFKCAFYYFRGLLLLSMSGGATVGSYFAGKKITDTSDKGYIAATVFLAFAAVATLALAIKHFAENKKPIVTDALFSDDINLNNDSGYKKLTL